MRKNLSQALRGWVDLFTRAPASTRGVVRRVLLWHERNEHRPVDAAISATAAVDSWEDREPLAPMSYVGVRDCNAPPTISGSNADALLRAE